MLAAVTAVMAEGKRPVSFRTRKLSPPAPMVLHPGGCGRVGHRRTSSRSRATHTGGPRPVFIGPLSCWPLLDMPDRPPPRKDVPVTSSPNDRHGREQGDGDRRPRRDVDDRSHGRPGYSRGSGDDRERGGYGREPGRGYQSRDDRGSGGGFRRGDRGGQGGRGFDRDDRGSGGGYRRDDRGAGGGYRRDDRGSGGGFR